MKKKLKYYDGTSKYFDIEYKPIGTYVLILINVLVFFLIYWYCEWNQEKYYIFLYDHLAMVSSKVKVGEYWRLITANFIHFDAKHLLFNMGALFGFSLDYEKTEGNKKYLFVYFISGLISYIASFAAGYKFTGGASGAIFGIIAVTSAEIIQDLLSGSETVFDDRKSQIITAIIYPIVYLFPEFLQPNVNNTAHVSGAITGIVSSFVFDKDRYKYKVILCIASSIVLIVGIILMLTIGFHTYKI